MILLVGALADSLMAYICTCLIAKKADFIPMDARHYPEQLDLTWEREGDNLQGALRYGKREVAITDIRAVYLRQITFPNRAPQVDTAYHGVAFDNGLAWSLTALIDILPILVINRPYAIMSNMSKPYQQRIIAMSGFRTPRTLITTQPGDAAQFYKDCQGRVIYKSVSDQRSIVNRMTSEDLKRLEQVRCCPTQFQECIAGNEVRVHTVGKQVFASEIVTDAVDYRYAWMNDTECRIRGIELPDEIAERCVRLTTDLGLVISGIDLRKTPEGEYYCFEVNPTPGFNYYQAFTGQRIGEALVELLCNETS